MEKKHYYKTENSSHKGEIIVRHKKKFENPLTPEKLKITPFCNDVEKSGKYEYGEEKPEDIAKEEICIDSKFFRELIEHEEKKDE